VVNSNFVPAPDPAGWRPEVPPPPGIFDVTVGQGFAFVPAALNIQGQQRHSVSSGDPCTIDKQFCLPDNTNCQAGTLSNAGTVYRAHFFSVWHLFLLCAGALLDRQDWRDQCCALGLGAYSSTGRSASWRDLEAEGDES